ncbi:DUF58 domain-containing protein [Clostridium omnivorum]|uniref:DUF58 domain-containing protein n=1 Tax=Clostridium omnivorum TaxID=1604902 RepID=A0ABQ5N393_9CLOT|nr:DUF58 domain-containing protein [Clostridium sp. E14]GLC29678.1 hypothetical protein bsdE14_10880 [Clostridium sp. E14]
MIGYFIFLFIIIFLILFAEYTRTKGFEKLSVKREVLKSEVMEGEKFNITIVVENNKWLPISFLLLKEVIPSDLGFLEDDDAQFTKEDAIYHVSRLNVLWYERLRRSYEVKAKKRGAYLIKDIRVTIGDYFGFLTKDEIYEDYIELLVYPKLVDVERVGFETTNLYGDNVIKRWIHKDPLYIKGIREYTVEDRMKDIHWKSSLKMNKLMVKDYDYTSELEFMIILNVQCGDPYWYSIDEKAVETGVKLASSIALKTTKEGIPTGMWTNAHVVAYNGEGKGEVAPSVNSFKSILELCARIDYSPKVTFEQMLLDKAKHFNKNSTYIIITSFLNDESVNVLKKLKRSGFTIKLIDISENSSVPAIDGIEKASFKL